MASQTLQTLQTRTLLPSYPTDTPEEWCDRYTDQCPDEPSGSFIHYILWLPRLITSRLYSLFLKLRSDEQTEDVYPECNKMGKLLNFDVYDTCFLGEDWYNSSGWMFALTCLAVAALVFTLEALRMVLRRYDEKLLQGGSNETGAVSPTVAEVADGRRPRPSPMHQAIRALIYMAIVINAYVLILFAISFNGFILLSIFVASYFAFFFLTPLHTTTRSAVTP